MGLTENAEYWYKKKQNKLCKHCKLPFGTVVDDRVYCSDYCTINNIFQDFFASECPKCRRYCVWAAREEKNPLCCVCQNKNIEEYCLFCVNGVDENV